MRWSRVANVDFSFVEECDLFRAESVRNGDMSASFQLLRPDDHVDYMSHMAVIPNICVKELFAFNDHLGNNQSLSLAATSNIELAGQSNVNVFFNGAMCMYTHPYGQTVEGGQSMSNLLLQISMGGPNEARLEAGADQYLALLGGDTSQTVHVNTVVFRDDAESNASSIHSLRDFLRFDSEVKFSKTAFADEDIVVTGNIFGSTCTIRSDTVAYTFAIGDGSQLQLLRTVPGENPKIAASFGGFVADSGRSTFSSNIPFFGGSGTTRSRDANGIGFPKDWKHLNFNSNFKNVQCSSLNVVNDDNRHVASFDTSGNLVMQGSICHMADVLTTGNTEFRTLDPAISERIIRSLRPVSYMGSNVGLLAQEVEKVTPELVSYVSHDGNQMKMVKYEKLIPHMLCVLKSICSRMAF